jgi:hypothetical protein
VDALHALERAETDRRQSELTARLAEADEQLAHTHAQVDSPTDSLGLDDPGTEQRLALKLVFPKRVVKGAQSVSHNSKAFECLCCSRGARAGDGAGAQYHGDGTGIPPPPPALAARRGKQFGLKPHLPARSTRPDGQAASKWHATSIKSMCSEPSIRRYRSIACAN